MLTVYLLIAKQTALQLCRYTANDQSLQLDAMVNLPIQKHNSLTAMNKSSLAPIVTKQAIP